MEHDSNVLEAGKNAKVKQQALRHAMFSLNYSPEANTRLLIQ